MKLLYAVLAERVRPTASGQLIIDGTIEVFRVSVDPPYRLPVLYLAGVIAADARVSKRQYSLDVLLLDPTDGKALYQRNPLPRLTLEPLGGDEANGLLAQFSVVLPGIVLTQLGAYALRILVDGKRIGEASFFLVRDPTSSLVQSTKAATPSAELSIGDDRSIAAALRQTRKILNYAQLAYETLRDARDPERRSAAFSNVIVWGRAVTNVLQLLRGRAQGFDEWYAPWVKEMREDPLLRYLYLWRSSLLKQGGEPPSVGGVDILKMLGTDLLPGPPPAGALSFFMGDATGGVGWLVKMPDGTTGKIYLAIPEGAAPNTLNLIDLPDVHLGEKIRERTADYVARLYLHYLERIVYIAEQQFGARPDLTKKAE